MYTELLNLIKYLDSLNDVFNTIKRHSDNTLIVTIKRYKTDGYSREYRYTIEGITKALNDAKEFVKKLSTNTNDSNNQRPNISHSA